MTPSTQPTNTQPRYACACGLAILCLFSNITWATTTAGPAAAAASTTTSTPGHVEEKNRVIAFAKDAMITLYTIDAHEMNKQIQKQASYFSKNAWSTYNQALEKSGNLKEIQEKNIRVRASINGPITAEAISQSQWQLSIPLHAGFFSKKVIKSQILSANITVNTANDHYQITTLNIKLTKPMAVMSSKLLAPKHCPLLLSPSSSLSSTMGGYAL